MVTNYLESISSKLFGCFSLILKLIMCQCFAFDSNNVALLWIKQVSELSGKKRINIPSSINIKNEIMERIEYFGANR